jgi:hypothetical protein
MQCASAPYKGKTIYHITSLKYEALWNLRNLIFACTGKNTAGKIADFKPKILYGKVFAGTTEDDSYIRNEGQDDEREIIRSVLADIRPKDQLELAEDEEDEDKNGEGYDDEEEEDEEEGDEEDEDEEEADRRKPSKSRTSTRTKPSTKKSKSKRRARDDDEDDELEDLDVDEI